MHCNIRKAQEGRGKTPATSPKILAVSDQTGSGE